MLGGKVPGVPEPVGVNATSQSPKGKALGGEQQGRGQGYTRYVPYIKKKHLKKTNTSGIRRKRGERQDDLVGSLGGSDKQWANYGPCSCPELQAPSAKSPRPLGHPGGRAVFLGLNCWSEA